MREAAGQPALLAQQQALMHAEAMLLVDDHQPEPLELDAFLEQRVRADRDLGSARCEVGERARARRRVALAGEQRQRQIERRRTTSRSCARAAPPAAPSAPSPRPESRLPLHAPRRALRRRSCRSRRRLAPAAASDWPARDRARSPATRAAAHRVSSNGSESAETRDQRLRVAGCEGPARIALNLAAQQSQAELVREQLFEREAALHRMTAAGEQLRIRVRRRPMHEIERVAQRRQIQRLRAPPAASSRAPTRCESSRSAMPVSCRRRPCCTPSVSG